MKLSLKVKVFFVCFLWNASFLWAQMDTVVQLKDVKITAKPDQKSNPVQTLSSAALQRIQALQVSDAVKQFAGVTVKDYGGIGGMKTVSVRGLGATHTGVSYDGITIADGQSGHIDLGKFSMDNIEFISLFNGGPSEILQPARSFASGSLLSLKTVTPKFDAEEVIKGKISFKTGSFGFINPSVAVYNKINKIFSSSATGEWQSAHGKYPYELNYGGKTSEEKRKNTDVEIIRGEANIFATVSNKITASLKTNFYQGERGLPGATIYYNTYSSQRLWDRNVFIQAKVEGALSEKLSTLFNAKYSSGYLKYLDPEYLGSSGKIENEYKQKEAYISAAGLYQLGSDFQFSLASDFYYNTLDANLYNFAHPSRFSWVSAVNGKWENEKLNIVGTLVTSMVKEEVESGNSPEEQQKFSPAMTLSYKPLNNENMLLRFFYKDIFRMPTFNDLYYTSIGNTRLKPEEAIQFNFGVTYFFPWSLKDNFFYLTADFYHNRVKNKILAIPTKNLFIWSMANIGEVHINGVDVSFKSNFELLPPVTLAASATYTYQKSVDMTDPSSKTYRDQIAYIPLHSGSGVVGIENKWVNIYYNVIVSGSRYFLNHNIPQNDLKGYAEHGVSASKKIQFGKAEANFKAEAINILDAQYEVVKNFPIPGRSFRISFSIGI